MKLENKRAILLVVIVAALIALVGVSYAFFTTVGNPEPVEAGLGTATLSLTFADNDEGISANLGLGETVTKRFTVKNTGTAEASMSLDWKNLVNTYMNGSLTYKLSFSETENGTYETLLDKSNVPVSEEEITRTLAGELSVPVGTTYYYNLEITLNNLDVNQDSDKTAVFYSKFEANKASKYRYYKLSVNPNGGVWDTYSSTQEYLLMNNETKTINNPTRIGYTFEGWNLKGVSSTLSDNVFTMGISESSLEAKWSVNSYNLTIDPNGGTYQGDLTKSVEYGSSVSVVEPTREGYTFTGWEVSGGTLSGTTYTMSEAKDATLTATWQINNYKYIAYHNKMNINGVGYTRVEADTDEGESEYNSTVTPDVKTYTGFDSPSQKSITIKHETTYPPVLNKVEYNYDRHQHALTVEPNGGTYTGQTTSTMYYEASVTLTPPTKTGYNFTKWTASTGTINGNEFTMGDENSTVTANYEAKTFSITFNPNGGTTSTASKTVTYDSTYGELPTPTYDGYKFLGWFTSQEDGIEVKDTTKVTLSDNQTLYAHWARLLVREVLAKANSVNVTDYATGNKKEMFVFNHSETEQMVGWTEDERRDYRYIGNEPNNYIMFNDETWRIIGVFTVETEFGEKNSLMKIIRDKTIGGFEWDTNNNNDWQNASLQKILNENYYNSNPFKDVNNKLVTIGLNETFHSQIVKVKWYLGGLNIRYSTGGPDFYKLERGTMTCATIGNCSGARTASIIANVGLMYPSDYIYTYANGVDNVCYANGQNCSSTASGTPSASWLYNGLGQWLLSPYTQYSYHVLNIVSYGLMFSLDEANSARTVRPCLYLSPEITIITGDGSQEKPYILSGD